MRKYKYIFVVLVYRNIKDLADFFECFKIPDSKVIVVNSFFDDQSMIDFKKLALEHGADFLNIDNKGYGYGNNRGCEYAMSHYDFDYIVISNADIDILSFDEKQMDYRYVKGCNIIAPKIVNKRGINQNPNIPFNEPDLLLKLRYKAYLKNNIKAMYFFNAWSRITKVVFYYVFSFFSKRIYSAHGAFFIATKSAVKKLFPFYNDDMFLFNEERFLAKKARSAGVKTYYDNSIKIYHKEDGSVSLLDARNFDLLKQSYMGFYEYYYGKQE